MVKLRGIKIQRQSFEPKIDSIFAKLLEGVPFTEEACLATFSQEKGKRLYGRQRYGRPQNQQTICALGYVLLSSSAEFTEGDI